ncbi:retropepsin-like aspartic protease [Aquimarina sp. 2201CG14-23]|uniref:retropepsin-like aspartic protease n=1 Tax=Aquimarina mycalae TaxID=3040073 RepID=UPI002477F310|nr:aspartyl protease family protein [Aquimarina sp. 2201CG14-23]MDH7446451.1 aspartyl protease family protein [Aquimarina sp. 2201CG14-23]
MKIKTLILFLICSVSLFAQKPFRDTIPFRNDLGLIIIPIQFNGVEKQFVFDTGATHSVGFSWVKEELKKTSKTQRMTSSSKEKSRLRYYKSDSVNLASARITKHRILKTNDSDIFSCYNIDGILGVDIIAHFNWIINYKEKYVVMYNHDFYPDDLKDMHIIDFDYADKRPYAFLNFNDERLRFLLDTGATFSDVYIKNYNQIKALDHKRKDVYSGFYDFNGKLSKEKSSVLEFSNIKTNKIELAGIFDFSKKSNKIGNSLWGDSTLFLSLKNDKLYTNQLCIEESRKGYGCAFVFENNKITVVKVIVDSEAWKQGLRQGSVIQNINGRTFTDFCSLDSYQRDFLAKEEELSITLPDNSVVILKKENIF